MTTIAWDGTTLAADTRSVCDCVPVRVSKLFRVDHLVYAGVGNLAECHVIAQWLAAGSPASDRPSCEDDGRCGIVVDLRTGKASRLIGKAKVIQIPIHEPFEAMGSGSQFAMAAMALGKTAAEAVKLAMRFDVFTGGPIESVRVKKRRK